MPSHYKKLFSPQGEFERELLQVQPATFQPTPGFIENYKMGLNMTMYTDLSFSKPMVTRKYRAERRAKIMRYIRDGKIPENIVSGFQTGNPGDKALDWNLLATYAQRKLGIEDVLTDDQINEELAGYVEVMERAQRDMLDRSGLVGKAGNFIGAMNADLLDPVFLPGYFLGYGGAARAATMISRLGVAARIGAAEGLMEAVRQPFVAHWKNELGIDYNVKDAILAIAFTAGVAGGIGATAEAMAHGLRKFTKRFNPRNKVEQFYLNKVQPAIDEMADTPPTDPSIKAVDHAERIEAEVEYQEVVSDPWEDFEGTEAAIYHTATDFGEQRFQTSHLPRSRAENNFVESDLPRLKEELEQARARIKEIVEEGKDAEVATLSFDDLAELQKRTTLLNDAINGIEARKRIPLKNRILNAARTLSNNQPNQRVRFSSIYEALGRDVDLDEFKQALKELQQEKKAVLMHLDDPRERFPIDEEVAVDVTGMGHKRHIAYFNDYEQIPEYTPPKPVTKAPRVRNITQKEAPPKATTLDDETVDATFNDLVADEDADLMVPTEEVVGDEVKLENAKEAVERTEKQYEAVNKYKECLIVGKPRPRSKSKPASPDIRYAYSQVKQEIGFSNVPIATLRERTGMSQEALSKQLLKEAREGRAVLTVGDWSLSDAKTRSGVIEVPPAIKTGRALEDQPYRYTLVKFLD